MKWTLLSTIIFYLFATIVVGIPLSLNVHGISKSDYGISFLTTHESITKLMSHSTSLAVHCLDSDQRVCIRPKNYAQVKTNIPIRLETCQSEQVYPRCDDIVMLLNFESTDLFKIGLKR